MVGFGSSLRMGRRSGWEAAYLDYETLKLLLSQIEAVYEEQGHDRTAAAVRRRGGPGGGGGGDLSRDAVVGLVDPMMGDAGDLGDHHQDGKRLRPHRDYRDELFLENDSDVAFASDVVLDDDDLEDDSSVSGTDPHHAPYMIEAVHNNNHHHHHPSEITHHNHHHGQPSSHHQFSLTPYSTPHGGGYSSSEEDSDYDADGSDKCGRVPWTRKEKPKGGAKRAKSTKRHHHHHQLVFGDEDNYFPPLSLRKGRSGGSGPDTFIIAEEEQQQQPQQQDSTDYFGFPGGGGTTGSLEGTQVLNSPTGDVRGGHPSPFRLSTLTSPFQGEQTSLLPPSTFLNASRGMDNTTFESFPTMGDGSIGKNTNTAAWNMMTGSSAGFMQNNATSVISGGAGGVGSTSYGGTTWITSMGSSSPGRPNPKLGGDRATSAVVPTHRTNREKCDEDRKAKLEVERRRARKQRRRRRLVRLRREREKTVPPHIRIAHSKARAITERFLGLLRAEVEKVTLFAQARLGELADTAGSLRFLSSEELTEMSGGNFTSRAGAAATGYDYPLSDGGIHPSASSSSDEGAGGHGGVFPWPDTSSEEDATSKGSGGGRLHHTLSVQNEKRSKTLSAFATAAANAKDGGQQRPDRLPFSQTQEKFEATKRKIAHFQEVRRERPIFQRNDYIVGDDLMLVSAVDEADAYSSVGVELLHILKYICVNVIAVRKICRKHDRLLMNRMLGGYYHRKRTTRAQEERTLGGLIAHVAGDIYEAHPALIGLVNHGKLVGVYDLKIQQLANSRTVKVVSSCLALALSEYEVSRYRADALAKLNPSSNNGRKSSVEEDQTSTKWSCGFSASGWVKTVSKEEEANDPILQDHEVYVTSDDDNESGPPSTTSSLSLSRLRYTVLSIAALREASRWKSNPFSSYLSRSSLSFTGQATIGEGLDGCSRETLDVLLAFNPDAAMLLDTTVIYEGLKCGRWRQTSIASVMTSSLAVALTLPSSGTSTTPLKTSSKAIHEKELVVSNALGILPPKSEEIDSSRSPLDGAGLPLSIFLNISRFVEIPPSLLRANRMSCFLFTANYFVSHATAVTFVVGAGADVAYSAFVIGAPTLSAIVAAVVHCHVLSNYTTGMRVDRNNLLPFRCLLTLCALSAIAGNIIQAYGIKRGSVPLAILGRFVLGFSAAEIVHRQFIISFLPASLIVAESARLVQFQASGQVFGLLIGSLTELFAVQVEHAQIGPIRGVNWFMMCLWTVHMLYMVAADGKQHEDHETAKSDHSSLDTCEADADEAGRDSSDSSDSDRETGPVSRLFQRSSQLRDGNTAENTDEMDNLLVSEVPTRQRRKTAEALNNKTRRGGLRRLTTFAKRIRRLLAFNVSIPISLALIVFSTFSQEALFSSCALIADRYFHWRGNVGGFFLGSLSMMVLPTDFVCEKISRRYEERTTVKRGIILLGLGLLVMINWGSLFALIPNIRILFEENQDGRDHLYDWMLGVPQYIIGFGCTFVALRALETSSRSLLSKVSPCNLRSIVINLGTIVTFLGLLARMFADIQIASVVLSHRVINTDIVNSLVVPLFIACVLANYFVRKHYFFLM